MQLIKMVRDTETADVHPEMEADYAKGGWVRAPSGPMPSPIEPARQEVSASGSSPVLGLPDDWKTAHHLTMIKWAKKLNPDFDGGSKEAQQAIEAYLSSSDQRDA